MPGKLSARAFLAQVGTFLPAPALLVFGQWRNIFSNIGLSNQNWEHAAGAIGVVVGTVLALVLPRTIELSDKNRLKKIAHGFMVSFVLLIVVCFLFGWVLDYVPNHNFRLVLNLIWELAFIVAMCVLCLTLTFAAMVDESEGKWILWGSIAIFAVSYGAFRYFGC
jgi:cytochrome bd-type quinol oxidase subunit 2